MVSFSGVYEVQREHPRKRSLDQVVEVFLADCRARNLSPRTVSVRSAVRDLKVVGRWVAREGYSSADPLATVRLPNAPPSLILPLSGEQVAAPMEAGNPLPRTAVAVSCMGFVDPR